MIDTKIKVLGAIAYLNWICYLISYLIFRDTTISYSEESFYYQHKLFLSQLFRHESSESY